MKKAVLVVVAFVALAGIINCVLIEPALAYKNDEAVSQSNETHCGFICHSAHHQWIPGDISSSLPSPYLQGYTLSQETLFLIGSSVKAIFHPPQIA